MAQKKDKKEAIDTKKNNTSTSDKIKDLTQSACPVPNGTLILIGGAEDKGKPVEEGDPKTKLSDVMSLDIIKTFCNELGDKNARIEIITTASSMPEEVEKDYKEVFKEIGCTNIGFIHDFARLSAVKSLHLDRLRQAKGVYFTGGDQLKLTALYGGTEFLSILKYRYVYDNLVIAGTSAGAMAMSTPMIYQSEGSSMDLLKGEVRITTGLEFLKDVAIDTHFIHRGRFMRLSQVLATNPSSIAIGIEEDTAIVIRNGIDMEVIGNGGVIIIDGHMSTHTNIFDAKTDEAITIENLKVDLLKKGDHYKIPRYNLQHL